jgi:tRNA-dihydrouridine synthase
MVPDAVIPAGPGFQVPFAASIREEVGIATGAVGFITSPAQAEQITASGQADVVLLAREMLRNPYWPLQAAQSLGVEVPWPKQYQRATMWRNEEDCQSSFNAAPDPNTLDRFPELCLADAQSTNQHLGDSAQLRSNALADAQLKFCRKGHPPKIKIRGVPVGRDSILRAKNQFPGNGFKIQVIDNGKRTGKGNHL